MQKKATILILFTFFVGVAYSQTCLPEGINFSSQQQIDDFADNHGGCSVIEGDVMIFEGSGDITNLNGLLGLTKIEGNLDILLNSNLLTLDGLDNLTEVEGFVKLSYSPNLNGINGLKNLTTIGDDLLIVSTNISDLSGLEKLETVSGDLEITSNSSLISLSGLESLTSVGGDFILEQSSLLADVEGLKELVSIGGNAEISYVGISDFSGLEKLTTIEGELKISNNDALQNCNGLNGLNSLGGNLYFLGNPALTSFSGLNLSSIGGIFTISNNDALPNLDGLNNLTSVGNYLNIAHNDELVSFNGLNALTSIGGNLNIVNNPLLADISAIETIDPSTIVSNTDFTSDIEIHQNDLLSICENIAICQALNSGKSASINNNAPGCNSEEEVEEVCASSILPVAWSEPLNVIREENGHLLTFATAQEVNNQKFILERSKDGIQFHNMDEIDGQGTSSKVTHYALKDDAPLNGMNYYRIKQVDYDAHFSYSNIAAIRNSSETTLLNLYPNPASTTLHMESLDTRMEIQIYNYQGTVVKKMILDSGLNSISTEELLKGMYLLKADNGVTVKFMIH